jgi:hypothetical protein
MLTVAFTSWIVTGSLGSELMKICLCNSVVRQGGSERYNVKLAKAKRRKCSLVTVIFSFA